MSEDTKPVEVKKPDAVIPRSVLLPFMLVTTLFALWGFANDVTNPLVAAFKNIFLISNAQSSLVQFAFYGGYATMAIPAAIFIRRFSYKAGILVGLALYATGAFIVIPAAIMMNFWVFLIALYVITFGLAFLETTANPYILAMGPPSTATRRLNFAQAFNPIGSLTGMAVAMFVVLGSLAVEDFRGEQRELIETEYAALYEENAAAFEADPEGFKAVIEADVTSGADLRVKLDSLAEGTEERDEALEEYQEVRNSVIDKNLAVNGTPNPMPRGRLEALVGTALKDYSEGKIAFSQKTGNERFEDYGAMKLHDLKVVRLPYVSIGMVIVVMFLVFAVAKLPKAGGDDPQIHFMGTVRNLFNNPRYLGGVVAQTFYVGAQISCWTFIIQYGQINLGMSAKEAQGYNICAMAIFCSSRFVCTYLLKYVSPGGLLAVLAAGGLALTGGTIFIEGIVGMYCLVGVSACMSLMFPTIYGIALDGLGEDAKLGSAGLIFAIVGGAMLPLMQGRILDMGDPFTGSMNTIFGEMQAINVTFFLPFFCFIVIAIFGLLTHKKRPLRS